MEQRKSVFSSILTPAIVTALVMIIFSVGTYMANIWMVTGMQWVPYVLLLLGLIWAIRDRREKILGGNITFGEGFITGLVFSLVVSVITAIFGYIMMTMIAPDMIDEILKMQETKLVEKGLSEEQIATAQRMSAPFMKPPILMLFGLVFYTLFGLVASLIVAAIFKKENPNLQQPQ